MNTILSKVFACLGSEKVILRQAATRALETLLKDSECRLRDLLK